MSPRCVKVAGACASLVLGGLRDPHAIPPHLRAMAIGGSNPGPNLSKRVAQSPLYSYELQGLEICRPLTNRQRREMPQTEGGIVAKGSTPSLLWEALSVGRNALSFQTGSRTLRMVKLQPRHNCTRSSQEAPPCPARPWQLVRARRVRGPGDAPFTSSHLRALRADA